LMTGQYDALTDDVLHGLARRSMCLLGGRCPGRFFCASTECCVACVATWSQEKQTASSHNKQHTQLIKGRTKLQRNASRSADQQAAHANTIVCQKRVTIEHAKRNSKPR
jgi:hypothetical protein